MNRKELHDFIKEKQPNICQISCYKDGKEVILMNGIIIKKEILVMLCLQPKVS